MNIVYSLCAVLFFSTASAQSLSDLPLWNRQQMTVGADWLISHPDARAGLYRSDNGNLVFSNGLVARTFTVSPNCATVGLGLLNNNESFLRSVRPEAEIRIDGIPFGVRGLKGQPIQNYLLPEWLTSMYSDPYSFKLVDLSLSEIKARFPWKKKLEWMPKDMPWPPPGKELIFSYKLDDNTIKLISEKLSASGKEVIVGNAKLEGVKQPEYLKDIVAEVHYELYDDMPVFSKWIRVINHSAKEIKLNTFKSEILAVTEPESTVDLKKNGDCQILPWRPITILAGCLTKAFYIPASPGMSIHSI